MQLWRRPRRNNALYKGKSGTVKEEPTTINEFLAVSSQTRCINLIRSLPLHGCIDRLTELANFSRFTVEDVEDLDLLKTTYLVRYKPNSQGQAGWQYLGSENYTVDEYTTAIQEEKDKLDIQTLVDSLRRGLQEDIVVIAAQDYTLNARIIVDGNHRAVALARLMREDPTALRNILSSSHKILILELRSKWAHVIYPCDFLNLCARFGPQQSKTAEQRS